MFSSFKYDSVPLASISLDDQNPRLVTRNKLASQTEIIRYFFEHEDLTKFMRKICAEGKNKGAERPYVIKVGAKYIVIEGNTRIASYKILAGLEKAPKPFDSSIPTAPKALLETLKEIEVSVAPSRDALLPIMASAHFGSGDKSKWGYLGSRKAVHDEWQAGKSISQLSKVFKLTQGEINDLIIEYKLYLEAIKLKWTSAELAKLEDPGVKFNPPVRFLETSGHKKSIGIQYDKTNLKIMFLDTESKKRFRHLVLKLVVSPENGLGATATYEAVFKDYSPKTKDAGKVGDHEKDAAKAADGATESSGNTSPSGGAKGKPNKPFALFTYETTLITV